MAGAPESHGHVHARVSMHIHAHMSIHVSTHVPIHMSTHTFTDMSVHMSIHMATHVSVLMFALMSSHVSIGTSMHTHDCPIQVVDRRARHWLRLKSVPETKAPIARKKVPTFVDGRCGR